MEMRDDHRLIVECQRYGSYVSAARWSRPSARRVARTALVALRRFGGSCVPALWPTGVALLELGLVVAFVV